MDTSLFRIYSIGRSAVNKKRSKTELEILPIEKMTLANGEIVDIVEENIVEGEDAFGGKYKKKGRTANTIKAYWLPFGSNRKTPPDVRRGERVLIWRFGDADIFYWTTTGLDDYLRRLETVIYCFSNTKDESVKELTPDNSWYIEVSTHDKKITLKTNRSDGEKVSYALQFDITKGIFVLEDDLGNYIKLDSFERIITLKNADDSILALNKTIIEGQSIDAIKFKTKNYTLDAEDSKVRAKNMESTGTNFKVTAKTDITGKTDVVGAFGASGKSTLQGGADISGAVTNNGTNIGSTHRHSETNSVTSTPI